MIKKSLLLMIFVLTSVFVCGCQGNNTPDDITHSEPLQPEEPAEPEQPAVPEQTRWYTNPVISELNCADPTLLDNRAKDGYFYAYTTQTSGIILPTYRSKNLVDWEKVDGGFEEGKNPAWTKDKANLWAPDINYVDGKYVLYYALGIWGDLVQSASGVAVSASPSGPFKDLGKVVDYSVVSIKNTIDPCFFKDGNKKYLYFGSVGRSSGIWVVELADDAVSIKDGAKPVLLAGYDMEAAYMLKRGNHYYLFASRGSCCENENSTYHVIVGRSNSPTGPFFSSKGVPMIDVPAYDQVVIEGSSDKYFVGTGHHSQIIEDDAGQYWMLLHSYYKEDGYKRRCLCLEQIFWTDDGWPYSNNNNVSQKAKAPIFID